ncbi:tetratricopeptide repeat-containing sensor histidine kinase [Flavobacterium sedimenticola]|uniref:histidine kinase n=1 Tax=Flavobacterium sedimenticola TaxID=3043286 RepID=A0ABT6XS30_9FLAO|nr:histidine kinase [Flavobacterium sedimenticola]MDI9257885.1 histidine kinase [Flavobacterium sedimenticola]
MRVLISFFLFIVISFEGYSQIINSLHDDQSYIDSLTLKIKYSKNDSLNCILHLQIANCFRRNKNYEKYSTHLNEALELVKSSEFLRDYASFFKISEIHIKGDYIAYDRALINCNQKLKKYNHKEIYKLRTNIILNRCIMQQLFDKENESMRLLTKEAVPLALKSGDYELLGLSYKMLGIIFYNYPDFEKAENYLKKSIYYFSRCKPNHSPTLKENTIETGIVYSEILLEKEKLKLAKEQLDKVYSLLKMYPDSNLFPNYYYAIGFYYQKKGNHNKAIEQFEKGIENCKRHHDVYTERNILYLLQSSLTSLKKYDKAEAILNKLLNNKDEFALNRKNYLYSLGNLYEETNEFKKATFYKNEFIKFTDSLYRSDKKKEMSENEAKFRNFERELEIKRLEQQKTQANLSAQRARLQFLTFALTSLTLLIILISIWFNYKNQKKLALEKELINAERLEALKSLKEVEVMQALIDGEEFERKRIARELHDGIGSKLSALKIKLSSILNENKGLNQLKDVDTLLSSSITELRNVSYNLVPEVLLKLGLENALNDLCHLLQSDKVKIELQFFGNETSIPISSQINIYRIIQELLNNAIKHAQCTEILISCSQNDKLFFISVEDNGIGMEVRPVNSYTSLGLRNVKNRVESMDGSLSLESSSLGTFYDIELKI